MNSSRRKISKLNVASSAGTEGEHTWLLNSSQCMLRRNCSAVLPLGRKRDSLHLPYCWFGQIVRQPGTRERRENIEKMSEKMSKQRPKLPPNSVKFAFWTPIFHWIWAFSSQTLCIFQKRSYAWTIQEFCYGKFCHGKLWVRDSNRKSAEDHFGVVKVVTENKQGLGHFFVAPAW